MRIFFSALVGLLALGSWQISPPASALSARVEHEGTRGSAQPGATNTASAEPAAPDSTYQLRITSPAQGAVVEAGSTIMVTVTRNPGITVERVVVAGPEAVVSSTQAPFVLAFQIPRDALGSTRSPPLARAVRWARVINLRRWRSRCAPAPS